MTATTVLLLAGGLACGFTAGARQNGTDAGTDAPLDTADGRQLIPLPDVGGGGPDLEPSIDVNCGLSQFALDRIPPDVLILQDRSGTMTNKLSGHTLSKWDETVTALNQVVAETQGSIRWGLKLFAMPVPEGGKCGVPDGTTVEIGPNNAASIATALADNPAADDSATPTRFAVQKAVTYLGALDDEFPKYILLATDGLPNCAEGIGGDNNDPDKEQAIQAVADAKAAGIPVFVVGIAISSGPSATLNSMATAGGFPRNDPTTQFYPVSGTAELVDALKLIGGQVATCSFSLASAPPVPDNIAVDTESDRIPRDKGHTNGWDYVDASMTAIQIYGSWCDGVKSGAIKTVRAIFGCEGQPIP